MRPDDVEAADRVMRLAFGARGVRDFVRIRFRAAPDRAWVVEADGEVAGSVFATRWGSFGFFGPLSVHPELWDRGIGGRLLQPVLEAFEGWGLSQAGLFTVADSPKHLGLYEKHGFLPGAPAVLAAKVPAAASTSTYGLVSLESAEVLAEIRELTDRVFPGLDVEGEVVAAAEQRLGDTVLVRGDGALEGVAVCHCDAAAGAGTCYVTFGAVRPGEDAGARFDRLLDACEAFAAASGTSRLVAGVNTARLDAYRRLLARGFRTERTGLSMRLHPEGPHFDTPAHYVIDDLR
jgi:N-acetylglutamate synthase-like GNAT family acetyltransferase